MRNDTWVIFDGRLKSVHEKIVPVHSRGLMYGDGCFETLRGYSGYFFELDKHLDRLKEGARFLGMVIPDLLKGDACRELLHELLEKNALLDKDAVVRIQVWREGDRGYQSDKESAAHFSVTTSEYNTGRPVAQTLACVDVRRIPNQALPSQFKLSNGINYIMASREASEKRADDALMLTVDGYISETTIANIFWVQGSVIHTPSVACDLLPGITRAAVIDLLKSTADFDVQEGKYQLEDILKADAIWVCNSVRELVPVTRIDNYVFPNDHTVFDKVREEFEAYRNENLRPLK